MSAMDDEWIFPNQTADEARWEQKKLKTILKANHQTFEKEYQANFTSQHVDPRTRYEEEIYRLQSRYEEEIHKLRTRLHELEGEKNIQLKKQIAEMSLRIEYPAVQEAWEQLEIIKKLVQK